MSRIAVAVLIFLETAWGAPGNHFRIDRNADARPGSPVWIWKEMPSRFNPDSVRVKSLGSEAGIGAKVDW